MIKGLTIVFTGLFTLFLFGCQQEQVIEVKNPKTPYHSEEAIENGDVVDLHGEISNLDRFEDFVESVENGVKDGIRITIYTDEGDPIYNNLDYDGNKIQYTYDNSQDGFAGSGQGVRSTFCSGIKAKENEDGVEYRLSGCSSDVGDTFYFVVVE
ncbi:DUF4362 domain-containing protein [Sutcliffiella deserti]|uniref:DUF4362 domain-containing protein n=1 Tax=Sutcliffiella deserti TaxID=2875501 RepID=UPI001CC0FC8C|nr:DUF4362 domain-containing protein [Sutcliffiella deserti]